MNIIYPIVICQISLINYIICVGLVVTYTAPNLVQNSEPVAKNICITDVR